jgi:hypothetical protein
MQTMYTIHSGKTYRKHMPASEACLGSGIPWGRFDELFTAAYWCGQVWQAAVHGRYRDLSLGMSLVEETAACLLGGYGMPAEVGLAAFRRLRDRGLLSGMPSATELEGHLAEPFTVSASECTIAFRDRRRPTSRPAWPAWQTWTRTSWTTCHCANSLPTCRV